jgi:hypothetical protein
MFVSNKSTKFYNSISQILCCNCTDVYLSFKSDKQPLHSKEGRGATLVDRGILVGFLLIPFFVDGV